MRKVQGSEYYDNLFSSSDVYNLHYKESPYYILYTQILQFIKKIPNARILEIGCGSGQFAHYLFDEGYKDYVGFDFSKEAIEIARRTVNQSFEIGDAAAPGSLEKDYNVVVALEILEHLKDDIGVIRRLKKGAFIVFSVPMFDDPAHVRKFLSEQEISKRYYKCVELKKIVRIDSWFACLGLINDYKPTLTQRILNTREKVTLFYVARRFFRRIKLCLGK